MPYEIGYSPAAEENLQGLTARQRTTILDSVDRQLTHEPNVETRNRKPMRPNPIAPWELRVGILRVYYDIEEQPEPRVTVLAVGRKLRNRVVVGDEEIEI